MWKVLPGEGCVLPARRRVTSIPCGKTRSGPFLPFPGAPGKFPDRQNVPNLCFLPRHAMIRRATLQRLCPQGKQRRPRTPAAPLAQRARQRRPTLRRRQAAARGAAAVVPLPRPNQNETQRPSPLLVGLGCVNTPPKALAGGTAALGVEPVVGVGVGVGKAVVDGVLAGVGIP